MQQPSIVILAAGKNSRFFPLNTSVHKGAVELLGKPLIIRTLENLAKNNFKNIILVLNSREQTNQNLQNIINKLNLNLNIKFVNQKKPLGMGHALLTAKEHLADNFGVIFPYVLNAGDLLNQMLKLGKTAACSAHTDRPWDYGILELQNSKAVGITEKPKKGQEKSKQKISNCYLLNQNYLKILDSLPESEYNFEAALAKWFEQQPVSVFDATNLLTTLKYPWHLFDYQKLLFENLENYTHPEAKISKTAVLDNTQGNIYISRNAKIGDFAKISGPAYIGENVLIGDYSFVRNSSIEANSRIGVNTELVRSIILNHVDAHYSYIADSIIGPETHLAAGLITANVRLDKNNIKIKTKNKLINTGRKKLGIITGEKADTGIRVSTMPGVLIGAKSIIYPEKIIYQNLEHQEILK